MAKNLLVNSFITLITVSLILEFVSCMSVPSSDVDYDSKYSLKLSTCSLCCSVNSIVLFRLISFDGFIDLKRKFDSHHFVAICHFIASFLHQSLVTCAIANNSFFLSFFFARQFLDRVLQLSSDTGASLEQKMRGHLHAIEKMLRRYFFFLLLHLFPLLLLLVVTLYRVHFYDDVSSIWHRYRHPIHFFFVHWHDFSSSSCITLLSSLLEQIHFYSLNWVAFFILFTLALST